MRFAAVNTAILVLLVLSGCSPSLERKSYPVSELNIIGYGTVVDYQPYKANPSETQASRVGIGFIAGGIIGAAVASGTSESDIGTVSAKEYLVRTPDKQSKRVPSYSTVRLGECVAIFSPVDEVFHSLERADPKMCP